MEYREAKDIGDAGEWRVAERLRAYCEQNPPAGFLSNLLLSVGRMTAQLDLVVVDPQGILIVEVKVRNGRIRGTADEHKWTAVYSGFTKVFQNPLEQLRGQRNSLSKAMRAASDPIDLDLIQGVVVFVEGDIDALELDSDGRRRVTTIDRLSVLLRERAALGDARLSHQEIVRRYEQLRLLDRSSDAVVRAQHAAHRSGSSAPTLVGPMPETNARTATNVQTPPPVVTWSGNPYRPQARPVAAKSTFTGRPPAAIRARPPSQKTKRQLKREAAKAEFVVWLVIWIFIMVWVGSGGLTPLLTGVTHAAISQPAPIGK